MHKQATPLPCHLLSAIFRYTFHHCDEVWMVLLTVQSHISSEVAGSKYHTVHPLIGDHCLCVLQSKTRLYFEN